MGVSLERVQFKFASIIGELCSEPDVLSQFAVWLDLRLAEYKLKGSISLDCSGEEPDPIWLKGLNKKKAAKLEKLGRVSESSPHPRGSISHSQPTDPTDRISPDVVVVKDEPSDVFPVGLHANVDLPGGSYQSRKRSSDDPSSYGPGDQWSQHYSSPLPKQRRLSPQADSPSNQSLMSVLSGYQGDMQESDTMGDNSSMAGPSSTPLVAARNTDSLNESTDQFSDSSFNNSQTLRDIGWVGQAGTSTGTDAGNSNVVPGSPPTYSEEELLRLGIPLAREVANKNRKLKISTERLNEIPKQTATSMAAAVGRFERWLWSRFANEKRELLDIPPGELDWYFAEFFRTVRTPSGKAYKADSFVGLRCYLVRYLKETKYPASPMMSPLFANSREAFKVRKQSLVEEQSADNSGTNQTSYTGTSSRPVSYKMYQ